MAGSTFWLKVKPYAFLGQKTWFISTWLMLTLQQQVQVWKIPSTKIKSKKSRTWILPTLWSSPPSWLWTPLTSPWWYSLSKFSSVAATSLWQYWGQWWPGAQWVHQWACQWHDEAVYFRGHQCQELCPLQWHSKECGSPWHISLTGSHDEQREGWYQVQESS